MILIVCVDNKNGMLFNRRRQSQDRMLRVRILEMTARSRLWMNAYSAKQFDESAPQITVAEDFLSRAASGEYCFLENTDPSPCLDRLEQVILYRWNRDYPADVRFTLDLSGFRLRQRVDFAGSSHEKITEEIYTPCET